MAAKKTLDEVSVSEKLDNLASLQGVDTKIDNIKILRGELPLEVQNLEDEIEGLKTRKKSIEEQISDNKESIKRTSTPRDRRS